MLVFECHHVTQVNWNPPCVICVPQGKEPGYNLGQGIDVEHEVALA